MKRRIAVNAALFYTLVGVLVLRATADIIGQVTGTDILFVVLTR